MDPTLEEAFERTVSEGERRLSRTFAGLLATGAVGGIDVSIGVIALLVVQHETGSPILGSLAFSIGFVALRLANSELFTENFLVPVATVVAGRGAPGDVARLWVGTALMNLIAGWAFIGLMIVGLPQLRSTAVEVGRHFADAGIGAESFASAVLAGTAITLMTWMERGTESEVAQLVAVIGTAFLLASAQLSHAIVSSLEMFAALFSGAPFGYLDWLGALGWMTLGNAVGGLALVTVLRLVQIGATKVKQERNKPGRNSSKSKEAAR